MKVPWPDSSFAVFGMRRDESAVDDDGISSEYRSVEVRAGNRKKR